MKIKSSIIIIYFLGCVVAWNMGYKYAQKWDKENGIPFTYGHLVFITAMSIFSWLDVAAISTITIFSSDVWDKPVK